MSDIENIRALAQTFNLELVGEPVADPEKERGLILFLKGSRPGEVVTSRSIDNLKRELLNYGFFVKTVLVGGESHEAESYLSAMLAATLPEEPTSTTLVMDGKRATVWVEFAQLQSDELLAEAEREIATFLNRIGVTNVVVSFSHSENVPTASACIRVLRRFAPCSDEELGRKIMDLGFDAPDRKTLGRILDTSRRKGTILRRGDGRYVLTLQGLMELGTARDRFSPDISRALALRRARK